MEMPGYYGDRSRPQAIYATNRSTAREPQEFEPGTVLRIPRRRGARPLA